MLPTSLACDNFLVKPGDRIEITLYSGELSVGVFCNYEAGHFEVVLLGKT